MPMRKTVVMSALAGFALFAAETVAKPLSFKSAKSRFSFSYPADWNLQELDGGKTVTVSSADGSASFSVTVTDVKRGRDACEYLAERAAASDAKPVNLLPEDKRNISAAERKFMGVDDGCLATYQLEEAGKEVIQGVGLYTKRGQAYIIEQKLLLGDHAKYGTALSDLASSFKTF